MPTPRRAFAELCRGRQIIRRKADRRAHHRRQREQAQLGKIVRMWAKAICIATTEREWRIRLLTGPDDRSLTGRILGDPRYLRSALYFKRSAA